MAVEILGKDKEPIKYKGVEILGTNCMSVVKSVDLKGRKLIMVGSNESIDRDGDVIRVNGWNLENFLKNPVFLWGHDYRSVPIGAATSVVKRRKPDPSLEFTIRWPTEGIHPFADMILLLYAEKIINASSVGFMPIKHAPREKLEDEDEDMYKRYWAPREFLAQELLELSGVPVPSNPEAIQNFVKSKGFYDKSPNPDLFNPILLMNGEETLMPENPEDVYSDLKITEIEMDTEKAQFFVPGDLLWTKSDFDSDSTSAIKWDSAPIIDPVVVGSEREGTSDLPEEGEISEEDLFAQEDVVELSLEELEEGKPYANEHACRLKDPGQFDRFARKNCARESSGKCLDIIYGIKAGKASEQAYRYKKDVWTSAQAKSHCSKHEGSFEGAASAIAPEPCLEQIVEILSDVKKRVDELQGLVYSVKELTEMVGALKGLVEKTSEPVGDDLYSLALSRKTNKGPGAVEKSVIPDTQIASLVKVLKPLKEALEKIG